MNKATPLNAVNVRTGNRRLMREVNSKLVLGLLRRSECISQVELLKKTRLSAGTVANIVKELKGRGFVEEVGLGQSVTRHGPCSCSSIPPRGT